GGSSRVKEEGIPLSIVLESPQETAKVTITPISTNPTTTAVDAAVPQPAATAPPTNRMDRVIRIGQRPLQGTKLLVKMAIIRSRGDSMIRVETMAAALHPNPIAIVNACFPWAPAALNSRSMLKATRGR